MRRFLSSMTQTEQQFDLMKVKEVPMHLIFFCYCYFLQQSEIKMKIPTKPATLFSATSVHIAENEVVAKEQNPSTWRHHAPRRWREDEEASLTFQAQYFHSRKSTIQVEDTERFNPADEEEKSSWVTWKESMSLSWVEGDYWQGVAWFPFPVVIVTERDDNIVVSVAAVCCCCCWSWSHFDFNTPMMNQTAAMEKERMSPLRLFHWWFLFEAVPACSCCCWCFSFVLMRSDESRSERVLPRANG